MGNDWGVLDPPAPAGWQPTIPVSVIIPAYQCADTLALTLAALSAQSYPSELLEVVVVDDGSEPKLELPEVVPEHCRVVRAGDYSTGWGRANALHVGATVAEGTVLHWLDADLIPFPEHVAAQVRWHHAAPDVVTLGYKRFVPHGLPAVSEVVRRAEAGTLAELFPPGATEPHDYVEELIEATDQLRAADHLAFRAHVGATAALRRDLYEAVGGLDTSLRLGEDSEFGYRLAQAGALFVPEPQARSWHLGPSHAMRLGQRLRRHNRPYLADRMALPRWLRGSARRSWAVPLVSAVVTVERAPAEQVQACVDRLLASDEYDLRVHLVGDWPGLADHRRRLLDDPQLDLRLVAAAYRSEPRVNLVAAAPQTVFPSPYLLRVPVTTGVAPDTVRRLVTEADTWRVGLVRLLPAGTGGGPSPQPVELWRTAAVSRAARWLPDTPLSEAVPAVWGQRWVTAEPHALVDLAAVPAEALAAGSGAAAAAGAVGGAGGGPAVPGSAGSGTGRGGPAAAPPVPVAGLRSLLRATAYVGRLAAGRVRRRVHRVLHRGVAGR